MGDISILIEVFDILKAWSDCFYLVCASSQETVILFKYQGISVISIFIYTICYFIKFFAQIWLIRRIRSLD